MPRSLSLCIECLWVVEGEDRPLMRCTAMPGGQPGLGLDADGNIRWLASAGLACELWVSADDRLIALRPVGAPALSVGRAGRWIDAPEGKPVVLLDQDQIRLGARVFRVHIHGETDSVQEPAPLWEPVDRAGSPGHDRHLPGREDDGILVRMAPPSPPPLDPRREGGGLARRYHGTVALDPLRAGQDATAIATGVISHLAGLPGARVRVTMEIQAEIPHGAPLPVVRTVISNGRTLSFTNQDFESEQE